MKNLMLLLAFLFVAGVTNVKAQAVSQPRGGPAGSWRLIGTTQANFTTDHDVVTVVGPHDQFRKLKFKVTDAPLDINRMVVTFDNGQRMPIDTRFTIPQGGESRVIDLPGKVRHLRTVEFWYDTHGRGKGKADVTLFGMK